MTIHSEMQSRKPIPWLVGFLAASFGLLILLPPGLYFVRVAFGAILNSNVDLSEAFQGKLFFGTVALAVLSATLATIFATTLFAALMSLSVQWRAILAILAALGFMVPGHIAALSWIQAIGNTGWLTQALESGKGPAALLPQLLYSNFFCSAVIALHYFPVALLLLYFGSRTIASSPIESGMLFMSPTRLWIRCVTGALRPWLAVGWLAVFVLGFSDYSVPFLLRRFIYPVEIMAAYAVHYDEARAAALSLPFLATTWLAAGALGWMIPRQRSAPQRALSGWPRFPMKLRMSLIAISFLIVASGGLLPLANLIYVAGGWANYRAIYVSARDQIVASVSYAMLASLCVVVIAAALAPTKNRTLTIIMMTLFALPASVIGISQIAFWNRASWGDFMGRFYDSGFMLGVGLVSVTVAPIYLIFWRKLAQIPRALEDESRMLGRMSRRRWWMIIAPKLAIPAIAAAALAFTLALHEPQVSLLLAAPGQETLSVRTFTLLHFAPDSHVAALSLISLAVALAGVGMIVALGYLLLGLARKLAPDISYD